MPDDQDQEHLPDVAAEVAAEIVPVEQFGALCVRKNALGGDEVLLITTRETKRWTIPKGWPINGLKPHEVAEQEAWEEAGVQGRARRRPFGSFCYMKRIADGAVVRACVDVHVLEVRRLKRRFPERRERKLAWVALDDATRIVVEPELQELLRKFNRAKSSEN
ncbi:NUDIX hydrolase [Rhizobium sp. 21-4511-3d]